MEDPNARRIVGDRIISETQYQHEKRIDEDAKRFTFPDKSPSSFGEYPYVTVPASLVTAILVFFWLDFSGWFWEALIALVAGIAVFYGLIPLISVVVGFALLGAIGYGIYYLLKVSNAFG